MANGVLGLGSGQAASLNSDLIDKLKTAERKSAVAPIETKITNITKEKETFSTINTKVKALLDAVKPFDLFVSGGVNAFGQKSASTSGDSVTFDAADIKSLNKGTTSVNVTQLAQKDVYQSNTFNATTKDAKINQGTLTIGTKNFDTTNLTYQELATKITAESGMNANIEQVGTNAYRLVVKSEESGLDNKLTISGDAASALGFNFNEYQSNTFSTTSSMGKIGQGTLSIGGQDFNTNNLTYQELASAINNSSLGIKATIEQNGSDYKLLINSNLANSLTVSGEASSALGISSINGTLTKSDSFELTKKTLTTDPLVTKNVIDKGVLTINGKDLDTSSMTPQELVDEINKLGLGLDASFQLDVNSSSENPSYKLLIKSNLTNSVTVSGDASSALGITQISGSATRSDAFSLSSTEAKVNQGSLSINGADPIDTSNFTYNELVTEINKISGVSASLKDMGSGNYKLVINSNDSLNISGSAASSLGLSMTSSNNILKAQNMNADVDGINYNVSSNNLTVEGLKITANKTGTSTINITEDNTQIETQMNSFITKYNELVASIESEAQSSDSTLGDKSAMRSIITQIKDKLFGSYGQDGKKSVFNYGIELDKYGSLSLNSTKFNKAVNEDMSSLQDLFLGTAEKKGLGTKLKETLDTMTFTGGTLDTYEKAMLKRETTLNEDKTKAETVLDTKYQQLALQFAAYGTIINQMESSFSGLKMMINQSTSGN